jgi:hypothetical protein
MQLIPITDNFFQVIDAFTPAMLARLKDEFATTEHWEQLQNTDPGKHTRLQLGIQLNSPLSQAINHALGTAVEFAQKKLSLTLYQNSPQLWQDGPGYLNTPHTDISPNLTVNIQIYLSNSIVDNIGTWCFDQGAWHGVPYQYNTGYVMFNPTQLEHGMKHPVVDQRCSLYQSYRATEIASDIW